MSNSQNNNLLSLLLFSPHLFSLLVSSPSFLSSLHYSLLCLFPSCPLLSLFPHLSLFPTFLSCLLPSPFLVFPILLALLCLSLLVSSPFLVSPFAPSPPLSSPISLFSSAFFLFPSFLSSFFSSHPATKAQRSVIVEHLQAQGSRHNTPNSLFWGRGTDSDRENSQ